MNSRGIFFLGLLAVVMLTPLLSACSKKGPADDPQEDQRTELQREQDCGDPQWKAANLGLWYNICKGNGD